MNEAAGLSHRGGLTNKQKREQEAVIYGLGPQENSMTPAGLTAEEVDRMRAIIAKHDQQNPRDGTKEFDLNNPPVEPYKHKTFPLHLTNRDGKTRVAHNEEVATKLAKKGYLSPAEYRAHVASVTPSDLDPDDDAGDEDLQLDAETAAEAAELDAKLRAPKKSRQKPE